MAATKITITLPESQVEEIRRRIAAKESPSVSGFIRRAVEKSIENDALFREMIQQGLMETGGPVTSKERAWARKMISPQPRKRLTKTSKRRKVA